MSMFTAVSDYDYYDAGRPYDERDEDERDSTTSGDPEPGPLAISDAIALGLHEDMGDAGDVEGDYSFERLDGSLATVLFPERRIVVTSATAYCRDFHVSPLGAVIERPVVDNSCPF